MKMKMFLLWAILLTVFPTTQSAQPKFPVVGDDPPSVYALTCVAFSITIAAIVRTLLRSYNIPIPGVVIIFFLGTIIGVIVMHAAPLQKYTDVIQSMNPYSLLHIVLPLMVFKVSFCIDAHTFVRAWLQILIISVPGPLMAACLVGFLGMAILNPLRLWTYGQALIIGVICTPIYPNAVIQLLKEVEKSKYLTILLEGESMLGVGTCLILFYILMGYVEGHISAWYQFLIVFIRFVCGGILFGVLVGKFAAFVVGKLYNDSISVMSVTIVASCLSYYICVDIWSVSGVLCVVVVGILLSMERSSLATEVENFLLMNWELIAELIDSGIFLMVGVLSVSIFIEDAYIADYGMILVTYTLVITARFLVFLAMAPILSRVGYGLTFRFMAIAVWSGLKGCVNFCLIMTVYTHPSFDNIKNEVGVHIIGMVVLTLLINASTLPFLLKLMGMFDLSLARNANMNNCVKFVLSRRERTISMLKMDRFLADANWPTVHKATLFRHPYKTNLDDEDKDAEFFLGNRLTTCPDCQKEIPADPTPKELQEMIKEARLRVLKAKKISYSKQYENGMISKDGFRILNQSVELAMDSDKAMVEVDGLRRLFKRQGFANFLRRKLLFLFYVKKGVEIKPPRKPWRRVCYYIVKSKPFVIFIYICIILNLFPIMVELINPPPSGSTPYTLIKLINLFFFVIYLTEFILKICAYSFIYYRDGFKTYFRSYWNILDFVVLIGATLDSLLDIIDIFSSYSKSSSTVGKVTLFFRLLRILRLLRLITLCRSCAPRFIKFIDTKIDTRTGYAYDIGKGFVTGEDEVADMLVQMIDKQDIRDDMRQQMEIDRLCIKRELGIVQREKPWIAITVKTKQAIMAVLNSMSEAVYELKISGWVDDVEYAKLMDSLNARFKFVRTIDMIQPSPPKVIFQEVSWMAHNETVTEFLYENVHTKIFEPGDKICEEGELSDGIFIIVTGLFKLTYVPNPKTVDRLVQNGELPIMDYIGSTRFEDKLEDYIVSGNCIGELCVLTERPYSCTIVADTPSQAYVLTHEVMREAMERNADPTQGLAARLWKCISMRLATAVLMEVPAYQSIRPEKIRFTLERAFVPDLSMFKVFAVNDMMEDIILIEGVAVDYNTRDSYIAPCYIPRTVQKITLVNSSNVRTNIPLQTKLLIIPILDAEDFEIMELGEQMSEMRSVTSARCIHHSVQAKQKRKKKRKRAMFNITKKSDGEPPSNASLFFSHSQLGNKGGASQHSVYTSDWSDESTTAVHEQEDEPEKHDEEKPVSYNDAYKAKSSSGEEAAAARSFEAKTPSNVAAVLPTVLEQDEKNYPQSTNIEKSISGSTSLPDDNRQSNQNYPQTADTEKSIDEKSRKSVTGSTNLPNDTQSKRLSEKNFPQSADREKSISGSTSLPSDNRQSKRLSEKNPHSADTEKATDERSMKSKTDSTNYPDNQSKRSSQRSERRRVIKQEKISSGGSGENIIGEGKEKRPSRSDRKGSRKSEGSQ